MNNIKNSSRINLINKAVDKALKHVVFDGWTDQTFKKVCLELALTEDVGRQLFPRGGVDMAIAFHERDDDRFLKDFLTSDLNKNTLRTRDRIEAAISARIEIAAINKESVKRSIALLTTPFYFSDGTKALWNSADKIWISIGDKSNDLNWYSKRLILSSIYSAVMIFWIEDNSEHFLETKDFIKRRITDVMAIERVKANLKKSFIWEAASKKIDIAVADIKQRKNYFPGW